MGKIGRWKSEFSHIFLTSPIPLTSFITWCAGLPMKSQPKLGDWDEIDLLQKYLWPHPNSLLVWTPVGKGRELVSSLGKRGLRGVVPTLARSLIINDWCVSPNPFNYKKALIPEIKATVFRLFLSNVVCGGICSLPTLESLLHDAEDKRVAIRLVRVAHRLDDCQNRWYPVEKIKYWS